MVQLYRRPEEFDLEHLGDNEDIQFYVDLARSLKPKSVSRTRLRYRKNNNSARRGRRAQAFRWSASIMNLRCSNRRVRRLRDCQPRYVNGSVSSEAICAAGAGGEPFDLIVIPCSSVNHLFE